MPFHLGLCAPHPPPNNILCNFLCRLAGVVADTRWRSNTIQSLYHDSAVKKIRPSFALGSSVRFYPVRTLQINLDFKEMSRFSESHQSNVGDDSFLKQPLNRETEDDTQSLESHGEKDHKEVERRRKIGLANKGKVPWNKGKKHTAETRDRIKQRTIEALRDPKVKKKMNEHPRYHSEQSKAKIGFSQRELWKKRLKLRQMKETFLLTWSESIATAAKQGGIDQQELNWDSYDKMKQEIALQQLQCAADKAKSIERAKIRRAEKATMAKAQKMARVALRRKEQEERKASKQIKRRTRRISNKADELASARELNLRQKLTEIHKQISMSSQLNIHGDTMISHNPAWKKMDIELIKKEKLRREVSLADQIQAARNKRAESIKRVVPAVSHSVCPSDIN